MQGDGSVQRRTSQQGAERALCKKLYRRSTFMDMSQIADPTLPPPPDSSDEELDFPRVVGIQVQPQGPIYQLPPKPRKVPPTPPERRESLRAPPGESLLPPPSEELLASDVDEDCATLEDHRLPLPSKTNAGRGSRNSISPVTGAPATAAAGPTTITPPIEQTRGAISDIKALLRAQYNEIEPEERPRASSATKENFLDMSGTTASSSWKFRLPTMPKVGRGHLRARSDTGGEEVTEQSPLGKGLCSRSIEKLPRTGGGEAAWPHGTLRNSEGAVPHEQEQDSYSVATSLIRPRKAKQMSSTATNAYGTFKVVSKTPVNELQEEGKHAIDSPRSPTLPDLPPQDYILDEMEERAMIEPASYENPRLRELIGVLIDWINDELASQRIIVKDIEEDLYDGQVLQKLLEKLTGKRLDVVEVTQSEEGQKQKLRTIVDCANHVLGLPKWGQQKWNVQSIHEKNIVSIIHLLVALARHFRAPVRLPENVVVNVVVVQKRNGILHPRTVQEELTSTYDDLGMRVERDAFDTLFDHAPDKLQVVKKSLMTFVNKHLNKINLEVTDLDNQTLQFQDGIYLVLLMGLLEGYFVPLYSFFSTPSGFDQKVHNVSFAFTLMQDAGLPKPKARPEDLVNADLKSTLRVLYNLFTKYKDT